MSRYNIYAIIRKSPVASGVGHVMGVFDDKAAALEDIQERNRKDPETNGNYYIGSFLPMWSVCLPLDEKVTSSSWTTVQVFHFPGTDNGAWPEVFRAYGLVNNSNKTGYARIYDATNGKVVSGELEWDGDTEAALKESEAISNLPSGPATFEVQIKRSSGNFTIKYAELR